MSGWFSEISPPYPYSGTEGLFLGFRLMASDADRLKVIVSVASAFKLRNLVVDLLSNADAASLKAGLAQAFVSAQNTFAGLLPLGTVATLVATTAPAVGKLAELPV